ncbi:FGGY family carbohydrate kinase [Treponema sp.]
MQLGIDLGTGSLKLMAVVGEKTFTASRPYPINAPESGRAETDGEDWVSALRDSWTELRGTLLKAGIAAEPSSIGLCGQMHGFVPIDTNGRALYPAVTWADARGSEFITDFETIDRRSRERLMNAPAAGMAALTLLWFKRYKPAIYAATSAILFPKDYIRFRLSGLVAGDPGDSSAGLLYDFVDKTWSHSVLQALGLDKSKLPPIMPSFANAGHVSEKGSQDTGIPAGIPVAIGSSDAACALYGSGLFPEYAVPLVGATASALATGQDDWKKPHAAQVSVGSGAQVFVPTRGLPPYDKALNFYEAAVEGTGYRMAAMLNGGVALEWVRGATGLEWDAFYTEFDSGRLKLPDDLIFLPYLAGERCPYGNADARGAWIGLGLHHKKMELLGAALIGVACSVRMGTEALGLSSDTRIFLTGGSSRRPAWRSLLASVLGRPLELCSVSDSSALGAANLGAVSRANLLGEPTIPIPGRPALEPIESKELPWVEKYYKRFSSCYEALYGKDGAY